MLQEFETHRAPLERLGAELHAELARLLGDARIPVQFVGWRVKAPASLAHKLARPDKSYRQLWDVTDLLGLRVATYFEDHVEQVARVVERHFRVDFSHSADRSRPAGYRSVHYVCAHERAPHPDFRFELQLRTVLQHAWAEVEHDLGYKVSDAVPEAIRRRFARVAGLLEIADQEFVSIRSELAASRDAARRAVEEKGELPIDLVTLEALVRQPLLESIDRQVAEALGKPLSDEPFFPGYLVDVLRLAGLGTSVAVLDAVARYGGAVVGVLDRYFDFARQVLSFDSGAIDAVQRGYGLLFVAHLAIVRGPELGLSKVSRLTRLYEQLDFPGDERMAHRVASGLVSALA
ncbi:MAG: GTP pyrophosphokinase [Myxococcota bacterium]